MILNYKGLNNKPAICDVQVLEGRNAWEGYKVVVLTELKRNTGMSVTNCIKKLAKQLTEKLELKDVVWLERNEGDRYYSRVIFQDNEPQWYYLDASVFKKNVKEHK